MFGNGNFGFRNNIVLVNDTISIENSRSMDIIDYNWDWDLMDDGGPLDWRKCKEESMAWHNSCVLCNSNVLFICRLDTDAM